MFPSASVSIAQVRAAQANLDRYTPLQAKGYATSQLVDTQKAQIAQLQAIGLEVGSKNVNDYVDLSIIEGLKKDGYFDATAKSYPIKQ